MKRLGGALGLGSALGFTSGVGRRLVPAQGAFQEWIQLCLLEMWF